jgi:ketosteroid isomerase-like protein
VESVLKAREAALAGRDLDAIVTLFSDDAIVVTSSGRLLIGKEQIRVWVQAG